MRYKVTVIVDVDVDETARIHGLSTADAFRMVSKRLHDTDLCHGRDTMTQESVTVTLLDILPGASV